MKERASINFLKDLVRIPSLSTEEGAIAQCVSEEMRRIGFAKVSIDKVGNVVGRIGSGSAKRLLFDAHMDTVDVADPSVWCHKPYGAEEEGELLYGRGAVDNKGALAAMVCSAKILLESNANFKGTLYVAGIVQEEACEGYAVGMLCRKIKPQAVILGEPTDLQIRCGQRGHMEMRLVTHGRSCHGSIPERGINAIYLMNDIIDRIKSLKPLETSPLGRGSIALTKIESKPESTNVVPETCTAYLDRRLTLGEDEEFALSQIREIIESLGVEAEVDTIQYEAKSHTGYPCRQGLYFPPWVLSKNHPLVEMGARVVFETLGYRPQIGYWDFSTDGVSTMGELGIPTVGFGPGEEAQAHTMDERIRIEDVAKAAEVYARLALEFFESNWEER